MKVGKIIAPKFSDAKYRLSRYLDFAYTSRPRDENRHQIAYYVEHPAEEIVLYGFNSDISNYLHHELLENRQK